MSTLHLPSPRPPERNAGFGASSPAIGAAHRASLGRGLAFVLLLAASSLASVYLPLVCQGPRWVAGDAPPATVEGAGHAVR